MTAGCCGENREFSLHKVLKSRGRTTSCTRFFCVLRLYTAEKVTYNKNSVTFYGSFSKAKKIPFTYSKKNFQKYGKRTFKLTSATKYYTAEIDGNYRISKTRALRCCKRLNGLSVRLKVKNGKVVSMTFGS